MQIQRSVDRPYSRLFFALWPDDATRLELTRLTKTFDARAGKAVAPHNFHVTLVFLGNVDQEMELLFKQRAADITAKPFELIFQSVSYWQKPKILCATCNTIPQQVIELASKLDAIARQSGLQTDTRPYVPHITLTRHVQCFTDQAIKPISWRADDFCLVQSSKEPEGVRYRVLQRWGLCKD